MEHNSKSGRHITITSPYAQSDIRQSSSIIIFVACLGRHLLWQVCVMCVYHFLRMSFMLCVESHMNHQSCVIASQYTQNAA